MWRRGAWLALPSVLVTLGLALVSQPSAPAALLPAPAPVPCVASPFLPLDSRATGALVAAGQGWIFATEAWLRGRVCGSGTLTIVGRGVLGGDELPELTVIQGGKLLGRPQFGEQPRTVAVRVPQAGALDLGFLNDLYISDVRIATVSNPRLASAACRGFTPVPTAPAFFLLDDTPLTLNPCGLGVFTVQLVGRAGNDAFPVVTLTQGGRTLLQMKTRTTPQNIRLAIGAEPLSITLTNPYFKRLVNRDLIIRKLTFTPDP